MAINNTMFTRYLYEFDHVLYSLKCAILEKKREEALFWAYELYHSGFKESAWWEVNHIYGEFYTKHNPLFRNRMDKILAEWESTGNDLLLGTAVGTLAMMLRDDATEPAKQTRRFVILYKEDRHATQEANGPPRYYLKQVSKYPVRREKEDVDGLVREAYLGPNWLDHCTETPIWKG